MGQERHLIGHLDLSRGLLQRFLDVALAAGLRPRLLRGLLDLLQHLLAGNRGVGASIPLDLQGRQPLARGPGMIGDDRHRVVRAHHLADALDRQRGRRVDIVERPSDYRTEHQGGDLHPLRAGVDAEDGLAVDLVR
ncbi:hypothetical protein D9M68_728730 [compost metagenome]